MGIASLDLDGRRNESVFVNSLLRAPGKSTLRSFSLDLSRSYHIAYFSALAVEATPRHCRGVLKAVDTFVVAVNLCGRSRLAE